MCELECVRCNTSFIGKRKTAKYCCKNCAQQAFRERRYLQNKCWICGNNVEINKKNGKPYIQCSECQKRQKTYAQKSYVKNNANERTKEQIQYLKNKVYEIYGKKCNNCGDIRECCLTLDHVYGGGCKDRKKRSYKQIYKDAIESKNSGKYQILCMNCNWAKRYENKEVANQYGTFGNRFV